MGLKTENKIDDTPPTKKQWELLEFICYFIQQKSYAPSLKEISKKFGKSKNAIWELIEKLKRKGFILKWKNAKRGIDIKNKKIMEKAKVKEIKKILELKSVLNKQIDKFLKKNYTEKECFKATLQRGEDIGFFKTKSMGKNL